MLLSIHVVAAIVAIGPVTVAASMFPAFARRRDAGALRLLHRICTVYATIGVAVPVFGLATASSLGVLGDAWLLTSIGLTVAAAGLLGLVILPRQRRLLTALSDGPPAADPAPPTRRLGMLTGIFNLLWAVVVVLMIVRPGSTTGA
jgi:hypothetical protein